MKKFFVITILFLILTACIPLITDQNKSTPSKSILTFSDEFNGNQIDLEKWDVLENAVSKQSISCAQKNNVEVMNGSCILLTTPYTLHDPVCSGKIWATATIRTKVFRQKYGYFEARYKYGAARTLNNAFWLMSLNPVDDPSHIEIDINEGYFPRLISTNVHKVENGKKWTDQMFWYPTGITDLSSDYHIYALEWNEKELIWYFDGKEFRRISNTGWNEEMPVFFSTEVTSSKLISETPNSLSKEESLNGSMMIIDYVRIFK